MDESLHLSTKLSSVFSRKEQKGERHIMLCLVKGPIALSERHALFFFHFINGTLDKIIVAFDFDFTKVRKCFSDGHFLL